MMNVFMTLTQYGPKWNVTETRKFSEEEVAMTKASKVVESEYGLSLEITLINNNRVYIPLSNDAAATLGDNIDISKADLLTLEKEGEKPIQRVRC